MWWLCDVVFLLIYASYGGVIMLGWVMLLSLLTYASYGAVCVVAV